MERYNRQVMDNSNNVITLSLSVEDARKAESFYEGEMVENANPYVAWAAKHDGTSIVCFSKVHKDGTQKVVFQGENPIKEAAIFGAKEENVPEETEVGVFAEEPEKTEEPEKPVESDVYEEPAGVPEEPIEEAPAGPADDVGDGAEEIFYEEEIENEEEVAPAAEAPAEEEDPVEIVDDLTGATEEEIESGIPEDVSSETAPEISEGETAEKAPEEADGGAEDDDLLARLKESLNSGGPDFPDDPLADLKEHENGGPQQQAGYEDFDPSSLIRRNRPGRDLDNK